MRYSMTPLLVKTFKIDGTIYIPDNITSNMEYIYDINIIIKATTSTTAIFIVILTKTRVHVYTLSPFLNLLPT